MLPFSKNCCLFQKVCIIFCLNLSSTSIFAQFEDRVFKHNLYQGYSKMEITHYSHNRTDISFSSHDLDENGNITQSTYTKEGEITAQTVNIYNEHGDRTLMVHKDFSPNNYGLTFFKQETTFEYNDKNQIVKQIGVSTTDNINFDTTILELINVETDTLIEYKMTTQNQSNYISHSYDFKNYTKTTIVYNLLNQMIRKSIYEYYPNYLLKKKSIL